MTTPAQRIQRTIVESLATGQTQAPDHPGITLMIDTHDGGFLLSRLTTAERDALSATYVNDTTNGPLPNGTAIYNTDTDTIDVWNGTAWVSLSTTQLPPDAVGFLYNDGNGNLVWDQTPFAGISVVTDNGDGTYTHNNGLGTIVTIDTRANSTMVPLASDDSVGAVGTSYVAAREDHKHPAQLPSADPNNSITVGSDGLHFFEYHDEVIVNAGALSGPAPVGAKWGVDSTNGDMYFVDGSGNWQMVPESTKVTFADQTANPIGVVPQNPPANPSAGDIHIEVHENTSVWWSFDGTNWIRSMSEAEKHLANTDLVQGDAVRRYSGDGTNILQFLNLGKLDINVEEVSLVGTLTAHMGVGDTTITTNAAEIKFDFGTPGDLKINGTPGAPGQMLASNGPGQAPSWQFPGKPTIFLGETTLNPAVAGKPSDLEIKTWVDAAFHRDTLIYYTGTDVAVDKPTHIFYVDVNGDVTRIVEPSRPRMFASETGVAPIHAGDPTTAEIAGFARRNMVKDGIIYYNGTDDSELPPMRVYHIDSDGNTTLLYKSSNFAAIPSHLVISSSNTLVSYPDDNHDVTVFLEAQGSNVLGVTIGDDTGPADMGLVRTVKFIAKGTNSHTVELVDGTSVGITGLPMVMYPGDEAVLTYDPSGMGGVIVKHGGETKHLEYAVFRRDAPVVVPTHAFIPWNVDDIGAFNSGVALNPDGSVRLKAGKRYQLQLTYQLADGVAGGYCSYRFYDITNGTHFGPPAMAIATNNAGSGSSLPMTSTIIEPSSVIDVSAAFDGGSATDIKNATLVVTELPKTTAINNKLEIGDVAIDLTADHVLNAWHRHVVVTSSTGEHTITLPYTGDAPSLGSVIEIYNGSSQNLIIGIDPRDNRLGTDTDNVLPPNTLFTARYVAPGLIEMIGLGEKGVDGESGYTIIGDTMLQWGKWVSSMDGLETHSFYKPFGKAPYVIQLSVDDESASGSNDVTVDMSTATKTGVSVRRKPGTYTGDVTIMWFAIGARA